MQNAFKAGELDRDVVVVVRFQGPRANGMPELHKLTPPLGVLQNRGYRVALVTDGRMSGASRQGAGGDPRLPGGARTAGRSASCATATSSGSVRSTANLSRWSMRPNGMLRPLATPPSALSGTGRELFGLFRGAADEAEKGASAVLAGGGL